MISVAQWPGKAATIMQAAGKPAAPPGRFLFRGKAIATTWISLFYFNENVLTGGLHIVDEWLKWIAWAFGWTQVLTIIGFMIRGPLPSAASERSSDGASKNWKRRKSTWRWKHCQRHVNRNLSLSTFADRWLTVTNGQICRNVLETPRQAIARCYFAPLKRINQNKEFVSHVRENSARRQRLPA